jgi:subtilisin family serine protease
LPTRRTLAAGAVAALATAGLGIPAVPAAATPPDGPRATYVVTVDRSTMPAQAAERARGIGGRVEHVYTSALTGFAVTLPETAAIRLLAIPGVIAVERDQVVTADATVQSHATWGLDRTDQRGLPLSTTYGYTATGQGVTAYIIDTGIRAGHDQFTGRVGAGYDAIDGGTPDDCNGHGTHVAGTVGGATHGVAKGVQLIGVRVLDCARNGTTSGVLAGIDWVTGDHPDGAPAVANMSLGGGASTALDTAVRKSITDGVTYAVAAGNGNSAGKAQDACNYSPARVPEALTVGASDRTDRAASFSNYGSCVDLFAPGVNITSAWHTGVTATNTISGTSMATPHVAGVAALLLSTAPADPAAVATTVTAAATTGSVVLSRTATRAGTPNRLLFSNY